jgi:hypothetical protein
MDGRSLSNPITAVHFSLIRTSRLGLNLSRHSDYIGTRGVYSVVCMAIIDLSIPVTIIQGRSRRKRRLVTLIKNLAALHLAFYLAQFLIISLLALTGMPAQVALVFAASVFSLWLVIGTISLFVSYGRGILIGLVSLPIISLIAFLVAYYGTLNLGNPTLVLPTPLLVLVGVIVLLLPTAADLWILKPPPEWFDFSGDEVDAMPRAPGHSGLILAEALRNCLASQQPYRIRQQILRFIRVAVLFHH